MLNFKKHVWFTSLLIGMVAALIVTTPAEARKSETAVKIDRQAKAALNKLYKSTPRLPGVSGKRLQQSWCSLLF